MEKVNYENYEGFKMSDTPEEELASLNEIMEMKNKLKEMEMAHMKKYHGMCYDKMMEETSNKGYGFIRLNQCDYIFGQPAKFYLNKQISWANNQTK